MFRFHKPIPFTRSTSIDLDWRFLFLLVCSLSLLIFLTSPTSPSITSSSYFVPLTSLFTPSTTTTTSATNTSRLTTESPTPASAKREWTRTIRRSRIAVCLVGGARRFELTGPSIIDRILRKFPNSDLFLNCPLDKNSYKLSLLKDAPRIASVRIFKPEPIAEHEQMTRVLTSANSPNGIQGLLQYFNLVEGCLTLIEQHERRNKFTYDWILRTRVDGYWSGPLESTSFIPGHYVVPKGSSYGGLNDRFGIGDRNTSIIALSRLSLIPTLDSMGFSSLNSEAAFRAQLRAHGVPYSATEQPFCVVSDREYSYPPDRYGVPVAALSSPGPLSGTKCRPCKPVCVGKCVAEAMAKLERWWSWTEWRHGRLQLCDAHGAWDKRWEEIFDRLTPKKLAESRKRVKVMKAAECASDFAQMKMKATGKWDTPPVDAICRFGLGLRDGR